MNSIKKTFFFQQKILGDENDKLRCRNIFSFIFFYFHNNFICNLWELIFTFYFADKPYV